MKSDFDKFDEQFDSHFKQVRQAAFAAWIIMAGVTLAVLGFGGWVIVKLLQHFNVI
jgi:hypothetical protein